MTYQTKQTGYELTQREGGVGYDVAEKEAKGSLFERLRSWGKVIGLTTILAGIVAFEGGCTSGERYSKAERILIEEGAKHSNVRAKEKYNPYFPGAEGMKNTGIFYDELRGIPPSPKKIWNSLVDP